MGLPVSYTTASLMRLTMTTLGSMATLDNSGLSHHAGHAEAFINAKISRRYTIPFTSPVPMLEALATDLAIYNVLSSQISLRTQAGEHPWFQRFKRALDILDDIEKGKTLLITTSGDLLSGRADVGEVFSNTMGYTPTTAEIPESLQGVDPDKVEDLLDARDKTIFRNKII